MAEQNRRQRGRNLQQRTDGPPDTDLGLNMSLLDWIQLEPLGDGEDMAAAGQDLDFLPDLANDLLDEGESYQYMSHCCGRVHALYCRHIVEDRKLQHSECSRCKTCRSTSGRGGTNCSKGRFRFAF